MFRDSYQRGLLTIFFSCGSKPLNIWDTFTRDGYITKLLDEDIKSTVLEIGGTNVSTSYMICPKGKQVLGITMPFLVMIVKNLKKYFSFEVTILDDTGTRRRFRVSNFQSTTQILPLCTVMPIALSAGWNQIQFNMSDFCRRAYKKQFVEVQKFKINANIRIRRIYFADRILPEDQLPVEYKLFIPLKKRPAKDKPKTDEAVAAVAIPEKEPSVELQKRYSKSESASKLDKVASVAKTGADANVADLPPTDAPAATAKEPVEAPAAEAAAPTGEEPAPTGEEPAPTGEEPASASEEPAPAGEEPAPTGEEPAPTGEAPPLTDEAPAEGAEPVAVAEEPPATAEGGPEPVGVTETAAAAEEPATEAEAPATSDAAAPEDVPIESEPVRQKSVDAATQYEAGDGPVEEKETPPPIETAVATEEKTVSAERLETIPETD